MAVNILINKTYIAAGAYDKITATARAYAKAVNYDLCKRLPSLSNTRRVTFGQAPTTALSS